MPSEIYTKLKWMRSARKLFLLLSQPTSIATQVKGNLNNGQILHSSKLQAPRESHKSAHASPGVHDTAKGFFQHHSWATAINCSLPQKTRLHPIYSLLTMTVGPGQSSLLMNTAPDRPKEWCQKTAATCYEGSVSWSTASPAQGYHSPKEWPSREAHQMHLFTLLWTEPSQKVIVPNAAERGKCLAKSQWAIF